MYCYNPGWMAKQVVNQAANQVATHAPTLEGIGTPGVPRARHRTVLLVLFATTLTAFAPVRENGFVNWDDPQNVVNNEHFRGFSEANVRWMFTTQHGGHYHPLTWMSLAIDDLLWDARPSGVHLTSLLLHAAAAAVFYLIAVRVLGAASRDGPDAGTSLGAMAAALLFAIHPLRVESVAWATERRDVLCGLWLTLTVLCYLRGMSAGGRSRRTWL